MQFDHGPLRSTENDKGYSTAFKVLLIAHVLVGGQKHVNPGSFRHGQQVAVAECIPSPVFGLCDGVAWKKSGDALRRYMVRE